MSSNTQIFKQIEAIAIKTKQKLLSKGIVIPIEENNGLVRFDNYYVSKNKNGFFSIVNYANDPIVDYINLPQTAILLANKLALTSSLDDKLLITDRRYGYNFFEYTQFKQVANAMYKKKDWDRYDSLMVKYDIAKLKAEAAKHDIVMAFEKLRRS